MSGSWCVVLFLFMCCCHSDLLLRTSSRQIPLLLHILITNIRTARSDWLGIFALLVKALPYWLNASVLFPFCIRIHASQSKCIFSSLYCLTQRVVSTGSWPTSWTASKYRWFQLIDSILQTIALTNWKNLIRGRIWSNLTAIWICWVVCSYRLYSQCTFTCLSIFSHVSC